MMRQILSVALWVAFCATTQISPAATIEPVFLDTPLTIHTKQAPVASRDFATRLRLDTSKLDLASGSQFVFIENVPLDQHRSVTLQLEEASAVSPNATFVVMRHDERGRLYEDQMPWPKSYIYRGTVVGEPNSDVFLAIGKDIVNGWIAIDGTRFIIGTRFSDRMTLLYDEKNVPKGMINWSKYECGVTETPKTISQPKRGSDHGDNRGTAEECPQATIAIDTDFEFTYALFGGNETAAANYVATLVSAVSGIYRGSITVGGVGIQLKVQYLRLWSVDDDPWTGTDTGSQLAEFQFFWMLNMGAVDRNLAHFLSARDLGGGMAFIQGLCSDTMGYAVSAGLAGTFPMPLDDEQFGNWDPIVFAHETGHNFGMIHTHDSAWPLLEPTIDEENPDLCGNDECDNATGAPIMSYCHLCDPGYISNIAMEFDDGNAERAELFLETLSCNFNPSDPPTITDDRAYTDMNTPVDIYVLANDIANDCNTISIVSFDEQSVRGGTIEVRAGLPEGVLTYTPSGSISGTDSFTYTAVDGSGNSDVGNVVIEISRPPPGGGGNGGVNPNDVIFVITLWGTRSADYTGDGTTDIDDLLAVLGGKKRPSGSPW